MGFLASILRWFNPRETGEEETASRQDNIVDFSENLIASVIKTLEPLQMKDDFIGLRLRVADPVHHAMMTDPSFEERLRLALANAQFNSLAEGRLDIVAEAVPESDARLCDGAVGLSFIEKVKPVVKMDLFSAAVLTAVRGSLKDDPVTIRPEGPKTEFHIGRGEVSNKSVYRVNDIVIRDDDPDPAKAEINSFVSSEHADIIYRDYRFYLRATRYGCRALGGVATKMIHAGEASELQDDKSLHLLRDGDMIELGKSVLLSFNSVK